MAHPLLPLLRPPRPPLHRPRGPGPPAPEPLQEQPAITQDTPDFPREACRRPHNCLLGEARAGPELTHAPLPLDARVPLRSLCKLSVQQSGNYLLSGGLKTVHAHKSPGI